MPDLDMKNLSRFSFFALASVCSIVGGPEKALSLAVSDTIQSTITNLKSQTEKSTEAHLTKFSDNDSTYESLSNDVLIANSQFEGISSSISNGSDAFSENTLADSSSVNSSQNYSGNSNPGSYYWYRRNKNKNMSPSTVKAAFSKRSDSFSTKFSETLSGLETSSSTVSETLNILNSPTSSSISSGIKPSFSTLGPSQSEANSEPALGSSLLTSSFSQSF